MIIYVFIIAIDDRNIFAVKAIKMFYSNNHKLSFTTLIYKSHLFKFSVLLVCFTPIQTVRHKYYYYLIHFNGILMLTISQNNFWFGFINTIFRAILVFF